MLDSIIGAIAVLILFSLVVSIPFILLYYLISKATKWYNAHIKNYKGYYKKQQNSFTQNTTQRHTTSQNTTQETYYSKAPIYEEKPEKGATQNNVEDLTGKYQINPLLTKTEYNFYTILKNRCDQINYLICPKVRLEDFIKVTAQEKMKYRGYIKSRHIDFLICNSWLKIIAAIELDDPSHNTRKAQNTDTFKNKLFETINLPLYRIKTNDYYLQKIDEILKQIKST